MKNVKKKEDQQRKKNDLNHNESNSDKDIIDETLKDTFPASDAPSWYAGKDRKIIPPSKR